MVFSLKTAFKVSIFLLGACLVTVFVSQQYVWSAHGETSAPQLPSMTLTVVGVNGTQIVLNETGIAQLVSCSGFGGYKNQLGNLKGYGNYTGVTLEAVCDLVGGLANTSVVKIVASDDYSLNFTYAEVKGEFVTYDNVTGAAIDHSHPLVPIVAYFINDSSLSQSDGPLRMAIVSPEGFATTSTYWVKMVVRIEVIEAAIAEFQYSALLPVFFLTTLMSVFVLKVHRQRRR
jgi:hypothetical protein